MSPRRSTSRCPRPRTSRSPPTHSVSFMHSKRLRMECLLQKRLDLCSKRSLPKMLVPGLFHQHDTCVSTLHAIVKNIMARMDTRRATMHWGVSSLSAISATPGLELNHFLLNQVQLIFHPLTRVSFHG